MTTANKNQAFAGLSLADELKDFEPIALNGPRSDPATLREISDHAGFPSREPHVFLERVPPVSSRPLLFDERLTIRVAKDDKTRFEDLAYKLRKPNGEAFKMALEALEAALKDKAD